MPATADTTPPPPRITVVNGNLRFVPEPLLIGHYRGVALTGTERVMNDLIGGTMAASLELGVYPEQPGTSQVFVNTRTDTDNPLRLPRPRAVVVVGLGEEGSLTSPEMVRTVSRGALTWAQRAAELGESRPLELASTLIGSGGAGVSAGHAANLVVQGVLDANERLARSGLPRVCRLRIIELYLDRAVEAWCALRAQASASPERLSVDESVESGVGGLRSPLDASYRSTRYDFVSALTTRGDHDDLAIAYTLDTRRARTEVRAQATQGTLIRELVTSASNELDEDPFLGGTLFRLLVPVDLQPFLSACSETVIEVDAGTAGIPWELLDPAAGEEPDGDGRPWAVRTKLVRKLRTSQFRQEVVGAEGDAAVLVIGEPACDTARWPRLPAANAEAKAIVECLERIPTFRWGRVKGLVSPDPERMGPSARTVITDLLARDWRVVHISGHGEPPEEFGGAVAGEAAGSGAARGKLRGVVLSDDVFLGPTEIASMRVVPDLVFVNCCYLAARDADALLRTEDGPGVAGAYNRPRFAATVAEALIGIGVRCVIAAGWAVEQEAAREFAVVFYERLAGGARFMDAVADAREAARRKGGNTWAAYQCYGDPDWTLIRESTRASAPDSAADAFAHIASPQSLQLMLETIAVDSEFEKPKRPALLEKLRLLEERYGERWAGRGAVAEAFGRAWAQHDRARGMEWYRRALAANDGGASVRAAEQLGNLRARLAWETVEKAWKEQRGNGARASLAPELLDEARREIESALEYLARVATLEPTIERESLCGSAWKRRALLEGLANRPEEEERAIEQMLASYSRAEALARESRHAELFYPALNRMAASLILDGRNPAWPGFDSETVAAVRESLQAKARDDPDFWSVVGLIELELYQAIARRDLAGARDSIAQAYDDLHVRAGAPWMWASARDQLGFVLSKYASRADPAEREASDALLARLDAFAS